MVFMRIPFHDSRLTPHAPLLALRAPRPLHPLLLLQPILAREQECDALRLAIETRGLALHASSLAVERPRDAHRGACNLALLARGFSLHARRGPLTRCAQLFSGFLAGDA